MSGQGILLSGKRREIAMHYFFPIQLQTAVGNIRLGTAIIMRARRQRVVFPAAAKYTKACTREAICYRFTRACKRGGPASLCWSICHRKLVVWRFTVIACKSVDTSLDNVRTWCELCQWQRFAPRLMTWLWSVFFSNPLWRFVISGMIISSECSVWDIKSWQCDMVFFTSSNTPSVRMEHMILNFDISLSIKLN